MSQPIAYHPVSHPGPWDVDQSHLKTLAICHYVWGGLTILFSSIFIIHIILGVAVLTNPNAFNPPAPVATTAPVAQPSQMPPAFGWVFIGAGSCAIVLGWTMGILTILSGRCLARRRSRMFSLIMAGVNCLSMPIGTTLGIFTFVVLLRPSVQALYDQGGPAATG